MLAVDNSGNVVVQDLAENATIHTIYKWKIIQDSSGYVFLHKGLSSSAMTADAASERSNVSLAIKSANPSCHWTLEAACGIVMWDTATQRAITSSTTRTVELGRTYTLADLGLTREHYGSLIGGQTWSCSDSSIAIVDTNSGTISPLYGGTATVTLQATLNGVCYSTSFKLLSLIPLSGYELDYEPHLWNSVKVDNTYYVRDYTNCYAYILNNQIDPIGKSFGCNSTYSQWGTQLQQPGEFYNANLASGETAIDIRGFVDNPHLLVLAVTKDFEKYNQLFGTNYIFQELSAVDTPLPNGTYRVALYVNPTIGDYHWYRQNPDGTWSHKRGSTMVKDVDDATSPQVIYDPNVAANTIGYTVFVGYFALSSWDNYFDSQSRSNTYSQIAVYSQNQTTITPSLADNIQTGMDMESVLSILGYPEADIGSGIVVHKYSLSNGKILLVSYQKLENSLYVTNVYISQEDAYES